jgi:hypothetical protein
MSVNYLSDNSGSTIAVQILIEDWKKIKDKYPDVDDFDDNLPSWQKELIDLRLNAIAQNPEGLQPIEGFFKELDKED